MLTVVLGLGSALGYVLHDSLMVKVVLPAVAVAAYGRLGTMVVLVPVALLVAGVRLPRRFVGRCGLAGVADSAAFILFAAAITIGPLAVASVVISQGGTMAVLLGYFALRERAVRRRGLHLRGVRAVRGVVTAAAVRPRLNRPSRAGTLRRSA